MKTQIQKKTKDVNMYETVLIVGMVVVIIAFAVRILGGEELVTASTGIGIIGLVMSVVGGYVSNTQ